MRFFKYLGLSDEEIDKLPSDIKQGGQLIDGLQLIYEEMPEGKKKDMFASVIGESASILIAKINEVVNGYDVQANIEKEVKEMEDETPTMPDEEVVEENPVQDTDIDDVDPPIETPPTPKPQTTQPQPKKELSDDDKLIEHLKIAIQNIEF
jgi:hypothetical protein